jgi:hypothetical protein
MFQIEVDAVDLPHSLAATSSRFQPVSRYAFLDRHVHRIVFSSRRSDQSDENRGRLDLLGRRMMTRLVHGITVLA